MIWVSKILVQHSKREELRKQDATQTQKVGFVVNQVRTTMCCASDIIILASQEEMFSTVFFFGDLESFY